VLDYKGNGGESGIRIPPFWLAFCFRDYGAITLQITIMPILSAVTPATLPTPFYFLAAHLGIDSIDSHILALLRCPPRLLIE
jgi:hypothetical protein